jgi:amidase
MSASDWVSSSIMAKRGVASGKTGREHRSTDAEQGAFTFVYGPYVKPIMTLEPGDTLVGCDLTKDDPQEQYSPNNLPQK